MQLICVFGGGVILQALITFLATAFVVYFIVEKAGLNKSSTRKNKFVTESKNARKNHRAFLYTGCMKQINPNLSEEQKDVLFNKATESPFSGALLHNEEDGDYTLCELRSYTFWG
jgi:hypothetical protein